MRVSQSLIPFVLLLVFPAVAHSETGTAKIWVGHTQEYEELLETAKIVSIKELGRGANKPKRVTLKKGDHTLRALWKPIHRGPKESGWESYETEVAAYRVDRMLGLDMVPPTVVREIDGRRGSLQLWVDGCRLYEDVDEDDPETAAWREQMSRMLVFDALIGNDRGPRNFMVDDVWNVVLIDHSQAFLSSHYIRDHVDHLPRRFDRKQIERISEWNLEHLTFRFGRLLLTPQINAIIIRRDAILRHVDGLVDDNGPENVWLDGDS